MLDNSDRVIIGAIPPPRGGVAVYLERKVSRLRSSGVRVYWQTPRRLCSLLVLLSKIRFGSKDIVVELHTAHIVAMTLFMIFRVEDTTIFYDHNYSESFPARGALYRVILKRFLSRVRYVVIVGDHLRKNYSFLDSDIISEFKVEIPYIPLSESRFDTRALPRELIDFMHKYQVVAVNAAWNLSDDANGGDLYGIKWSIESFVKAYKSSPSVGFVAIIGRARRTKMEDIEEIARDIENIFVLRGDYDLSSILRNENCILLRTTTTDGDSLSVREAIELERPVIASDVVPRPIGAIVYRAKNRSSFEECLIHEISKIVRDR